jgi:hypothetical protein
MAFPELLSLSLKISYLMKGAIDGEVLGIRKESLQGKYDLSPN